jgi:hypothetical protein
MGRRCGKCMFVMWREQAVLGKQIERNPSCVGRAERMPHEFHIQRRSIPSWMTSINAMPSPPAMPAKLTSRHRFCDAPTRLEHLANPRRSRRTASGIACPSPGRAIIAPLKLGEPPNMPNKARH